MKERIQHLIDVLQGTALTLEEGCNQLGFSETELRENDYADIDNEIFRCETCGWWSEVCEMSESEDGVCIDCKEDER